MQTLSSRRFSFKRLRQAGVLTGFFDADALIGLCAYRDNEMPHPNFFPGVSAKISSMVRSLRSRDGRF